MAATSSHSAKCVGVASMRHVIVVDIETTGLNTAVCQPLEVAAINLTTGQELEFVPYVSNSALGSAEKQALQVNKYYERGVWSQMLSLDDTHDKWSDLREMLDSNTIAGCNPRFDAAVIARFTGEVWHHRLADLSAYAAGVLGIDLGQLPGLADICARLEIKNHAEHSASYDAQATAACFRRLAELNSRGGIVVE